MFRLEGCAEVLLVVPSAGAGDRHWLACRGHARLGALADWPDLRPAAPVPLAADELFQVVEIVPTRLDLIDDREGWGRRENLDL